jgi:hypothetical protein
LKVQIRDNEALKAVQPSDVTAYLRATGWRELNPANRTLTI